MGEGRPSTAETVRRRRRVLVFGIYCTASVDIPWVDSPLYEINRECLGKTSARTMFDEVIVVLLAIGVAGTEVIYGNTKAFYFCMERGNKL